MAMAKKKWEQVRDPEPALVVALKDFQIHQNEYHRVIKAGDDLSDVPAVYLANLIAEGVIQGGQSDVTK